MGLDPFGEGGQPRPEHARVHALERERRVRHRRDIADSGNPAERRFGFGGRDLVARDKLAQRALDPGTRLFGNRQFAVGQQHLQPVLGDGLCNARAHLARADNADCLHEM